MGLWSTFLKVLGWQEEPAPSPAPGGATSGPSTRARDSSRTGPGRGSLLEGRVEYVGDKFVKVTSGDLRAVVFLGEMADFFVEHPGQVVSEGDRVEFVLIEPSAKKPQEWVASLSAVSEARCRIRLESLKEGSEIEGRVAEVADRGVVLDCDGIRGWAPLTELAWRWVDHPSEVVRIGEQHRARVTRIDAPENWLHDKRARRSRAVVSIRACVKAPASPLVEMPFASLPFKVSAAPRKPRSCDPVVLHVLEEMTLGSSQREISESTGLPLLTLAGITEVLEAEELVARGAPTQRGVRLIEAINQARELNDDPIRGLFASAAHPSAQFIRVEDHAAQREYPRSWPRPPSNKPAEEAFNRATDEALPELLIDRIAGDEKRHVLAALQRDDRLRVFLRRDGALPWKATYVAVPEHWVLAGLWSCFEAVGSRPFRPVGIQDPCRDFLMVRVVVGRDGEHEPLDILYFEPTTATYWKPREGAQFRVRELKGSSFPDLGDIPFVERRRRGAAVGRADRWCSVQA